MAKMVAYCWRNGKIEIGEVCPRDALPLGTGEEKKLKEAVDIYATHAWNGDRLVPDLRLAGDDEALAAEKAADLARYMQRYLNRSEFE